MNPASARPSLFLRLLPNQGRAGSRRRADGHEEYLTQAVAAVLDEDPGLAARLLSRWCGETVGASLQVYAERPFPAPAGRQVQTVQVDLVVESTDALVFVENKIGAPLNRYAAAIGAADAIADQVEVYHEVLEAARGARRGHLLVLSRDPQPDHTELPHYRGNRFWWDLYRELEGWLRDLGHPGGHTAWLERELLRFFQEVLLEPPVALKPDDGFDAGHARRLLADAARRTPGLAKPRMPPAGAALLFKQGGSNWTVAFRSDGLSVFEGRRGARVAPELDASFWRGGVDQQKTYLADLLACVTDLPAAETARLPVEHAVARFEPAYREVAATAIRLLQQKWNCEPNPGRGLSAVAEISLRREDGLTARLAPYRENYLVLVAEHRADQLRATIERVLGRPLGTPRRQYQVNVPLRHLTVETIGLVIDAFEQHAQERHLS